MSATIEDAAHELVDEIRRHEFIELICHTDADGIAAGAIIGTALYRAGMRFRIRATAHIEADALPASGVLLCDLGSGLFDLPDTVMVIDHHNPLFRGPFHVNPRIHDINGDTDLSGAGAAYIVANALGDNRDLSGLVIAGILGDNQTMTGKNKELCQDAIATGIIESTHGLCLGGRTLEEKILWSTSPYFSGLSGKKEDIASFLEQTCEKDEKKNEGSCLPAGRSNTPDPVLVTSLLVMHAIPYTGYGQIQRLYGDTYILTRETVSDAHTMSLLLDACAKSGSSGLALAIAMRAPISPDAAFEAAHSYRMRIVAEMKKIHEQCIVKEPNETLCTIRTDESSLVSDVADGIWNTYPKTCPIAVISTGSGHQTRVSLRGTTTDGMNLGVFAAELAKKHNGFGGGHVSRAGATVPTEEMDGFINDMREALIA